MEKLRGNRWLTLAIISIGFLVILIDTTVVNVSIPTIIKDLHTNLSDIEWIITGYSLSFAALLITFGRLGDMYGRKRFFIIGLIVFTVASYFSGEAPNATILIIARLFQGVGGAIISPSTLSILSSSFQGRERSVAFGIWGATAGIAVAVGPVLGGFLTTYYSWRWIFRINIPIGIIGVLCSLLFIKETRDMRKKKLDISGMITSTIGFFFLVFALIEGQTYGWFAPTSTQFSLSNFTWSNKEISIIPICFAISAFSLVLFAIIQWIKTKKHDFPAINVDFFAFKTFRYGLISIGIIALGEFSSLFTLPIFLQGIRGFSPLESGYATLPLAAATFFAAPLSAQLVNKVGTKIIISIGIALEFLGLFLISFLNAQTQYTSLILPYIILGAGIGLAISQNTQVILSEIPVEDAGSASGVLNTIRQVGSALGIAIIGAVLSSQLSSGITTNINAIHDLPNSAKTSIIASAQNSGVSFETGETNQSTFSIPTPPGIAYNPEALHAFDAKVVMITNEIKDAINDSIAQAIAQSIRVGAIFVFLGACLSLLMPNIHHKKEVTPAE